MSGAVRAVTAASDSRAPAGIGALAEALSGAQYEFLVGRLIDQATLDRAAGLASTWGCAPHEVLLSCGWVSSERYCEALARHLGVPCLAGGPVPANLDAELIDATAWMPNDVRRLAQERRIGAAPVWLASPGVMAALGQRAGEIARLRRSIDELRVGFPELSAAGPVWLWQSLAFVVLVGLVAGGGLIEPEATVIAVSALISLPFLLIVSLRAISLVELASRPYAAASTDAHRIPDAELPVYSVLVPLYREAGVIPDLVEAIERLDYPAAKLDVILALEQDDIETIAAVLRLELPGFMRLAIVPAAEPRTKPKALNYALQLARGEYVVVYDAEDVPDPDQLRLALEAFRIGGRRLVCVQARLNIHNAHASWLARQFTLEYSSLFDAMLPALSRFGLPVPLGGTSNHFPRRVLEEAGGWDPFNVTEDADLGIRLARGGGRVGVLASTTWEEAPAEFGAWLRQRTRWLKGWIQTYLVHMREPRAILAELGLRKFLGLQALIGGVILSTIVHPWFYLLAAIALWRGHLLVPASTGLEQAMWWIASINLALGYTSAIAVGAAAVLRRGQRRLAVHALLMPAYWLLISIAAYRALYQLTVKPYLWEKTDHRPRSRHWHRSR
jgi:cellulose synthase/poly-beta-1,6-N-acetylglucosamine synthase-like glycosyltransferase